MDIEKSGVGFKVKSDSGKEYFVRKIAGKHLDDDLYICNCPHFQYHDVDYCKHSSVVETM